MLGNGTAPRVQGARAHQDGSLSDVLSSRLRKLQALQPALIHVAVPRALNNDSTMQEVYDLLLSYCVLLMLCGKSVTASRVSGRALHDIYAACVRVTVWQRRVLRS